MVEGDLERHRDVILQLNARERSLALISFDSHDLARMVYT